MQEPRISLISSDSTNEETGSNQYDFFASLDTFMAYLIELSNSAPYFDNNVVDTLRQCFSVFVSMPNTLTPLFIALTEQIGDFANQLNLICIAIIMIHSDQTIPVDFVTAFLEQVFNYFMSEFNAAFLQKPDELNLLAFLQFFVQLFCIPLPIVKSFTESFIYSIDPEEWARLSDDQMRCPFIIRIFNSFLTFGPSKLSASTIANMFPFILSFVPIMFTQMSIEPNDPELCHIIVSIICIIVANDPKCEFGSLIIPILAQFMTNINFASSVMANINLFSQHYMKLILSTNSIPLFSEFITDSELGEVFLRGLADTTFSSVSDIQPFFHLFLNDTNINYITNLLSNAVTSLKEAAMMFLLLVENAGFDILTIVLLDNIACVTDWIESEIPEHASLALQYFSNILDNISSIPPSLFELHGYTNHRLTLLGECLSNIDFDIISENCLHDLDFDDVNELLDLILTHFPPMET